jgi:hypothetical protein
MDFPGVICLKWSKKRVCTSSSLKWSKILVLEKVDCYTSKQVQCVYSGGHILAEDDVLWLQLISVGNGVSSGSGTKALNPS